jgi:hypothetical protein
MVWAGVSQCPKQGGALMVMAPELGAIKVITKLKMKNLVPVPLYWEFVSQEF